jgi:hypothetical protein
LNSRGGRDGPCYRVRARLLTCALCVRTGCAVTRRDALSRAQVGNERERVARGVLGSGMDDDRARAVEILRFLRATYGAASTGLLLLQNENAGRLLSEILGDDWGSKVKLGRTDGSRYSLDLWDSVSTARGNVAFASLFRMTQVGMTVLTAGDELGRLAATDPTLRAIPEVEFLRHLRNAVAHGNRFSFRPNEPSRIAAFGSLTITTALQGFTPVLFDFVRPGDCLALLERGLRFRRRDARPSRRVAPRPARSVAEPRLGAPREDVRLGHCAGAARGDRTLSRNRTSRNR